MTEQEIRIAVAEECGIKPKNECPDCWGTGFIGSEVDHDRCDRCRATGRVEAYYESPDFPNDLNAMQVAIMTLSERERVRYTHELLCLTVWTGKYPSSHHPSEQEIRWGIASAEAHHEAIAFLRVKGKWVE